MARVLQFSVAFYFAVAISTCVAQDVASDFHLSLEGDLVKKLEPHTIVTVSTLRTSKNDPGAAVSARLEDLPLKLPAAGFQNRYARVYFRSPSLQQNVFSMEMDASLLGKPRPIKLLLIRPTPSLRTTISWSTARYSASVSKRMRYLDLPYWDAGQQKLVPMPKPLEMKYRIGDGPEQSVEMGGYCMDFKWFATIPRTATPTEDAKISYWVKYESGGAFDVIDTDFQYDFRLEDY
jgi:hypothetical protein